MLACRCSRDAQTGLVRRVTPFLRSCCRCPTPIRALHFNSAHPLSSPALAHAPPPREGLIHSSPPECAFTHRLTSLTSSIPLPALPIFAVAQALPLPRSIFIFFTPSKSHPILVAFAVGCRRFLAASVGPLVAISASSFLLFSFILVFCWSCPSDPVIIYDSVIYWFSIQCPRMSVEISSED
ncbi:hypothetical protein BJ138DRAFT_726535 [Hygrophoropsis aurantiaca]|uniref:Uncharacterized protein n=1 Tax=Hygrophoropsis aurantiaca TaxID=72124 RepID=A0ACB7ZXZ3_9AGAM|nr:hypothetical protein BJ138DRAFT_726535 [Hygrophoropsis aurantiaca]